MSVTYAESTGSRAAQAAAYGGLVDAVGGIATVVLAIVALTALNGGSLTEIVTIVFGGALLIQAGTILSEFAHFSNSGMAMSSGGAAPLIIERFSRGGVAVMFLAGAIGIVLGILGLVGLVPAILLPVAIIIYGSALVLSSNAVRELQLLQSAAPTRAMSNAGELLADEMAAGSAGVQVLAGLAAIVMGIVALTGMNPLALVVAALLVLGATLVLTGGALSALVMSFMRPAHK
jgi:hypothetical protein